MAHINAPTEINGNEYHLLVTPESIVITGFDRKYEISGVDPKVMKRVFLGFERSCEMNSDIDILTDKIVIKTKHSILGLTDILELPAKSIKSIADIKLVFPDSKGYVTKGHLGPCITPIANSDMSINYVKNKFVDYAKGYNTVHGTSTSRINLVYNLTSFYSAEQKWSIVPIKALNNQIIFHGSLIPYESWEVPKMEIMNNTYTILSRIAPMSAIGLVLIDNNKIIVNMCYMIDQPKLSLHDYLELYWICNIDVSDGIYIHGNKRIFVKSRRLYEYFPCDTNGYINIPSNCRNICGTYIKL